MRIISGTHKGRKINPPKNLPIRPTTDRAKEALFSIIDNRYYFEEKNMLDLFCGSGNISFEFASRGVEKVTSVDNNKNCIDFIDKTAEQMQLNISTIKTDGLVLFLTFLKAEMSDSKECPFLICIQFQLNDLNFFDKS